VRGLAIHFLIRRAGDTRRRLPEAAPAVAADRSTNLILAPAPGDL